MRRWTILAALFLLLPSAARAQPRGAAELHQLVRGLTVTPRVLVVGVHPDDDDPLLIAWLARGRGIETGYLSLTRGEGGDNFLGGSGGIGLGALRTGELLAARRVDGGRSYFTRAYDFGYARSAKDAFAHWNRDALLEDMITVVRSFRPHVLVMTVPGDTTGEADGQHAALTLLARELVDAAADGARCPPQLCGAPWRPLALYHRGDGGLAIRADGYDPVAGRTYAELALESRARHRSGGLLDVLAQPPESATVVRLRRAAALGADPAAARADAPLFAGIDTSLARFSGDESPAPVQLLLARFAAAADSARAALDLARPAGAVRLLARAAGLADSLRAAAPRCRHPAVDATAPAPGASCDQAALDLDASLDLMRRRAHEALLAAAGITVQATADRELVAETGTVDVTIYIGNRGAEPVTVHEVRVTGGRDYPMRPLVLPPDSVVRQLRTASWIGPARPWWMRGLLSDAFADVPSALDGVGRPPGAPADSTVVTVPGVALPEELRRASDVRITLTIAGVRLTTSVGPIVYRTVSPAFGLQTRAIASVPAVTLAFERPLEWVNVGRPVDRQLHLTLRSWSNVLQNFGLRALAPDGTRVDALPPRVTLAAGEQRELYLHLRGRLAPGRYQFGVVGGSPAGVLFDDGFRTREYPHVPPVRLFRSSALYVQAVQVTVPPRLTVAYVEGVYDGADAALKQVGVRTQILTAEELAQVDLSGYTTVVIGPRALEAHPELAGQRGRLDDFARAGGTVVVLDPPRDGDVRHVMAPDAPVTALEPRSRLLTWPNRITAADWAGWVGARALFVPTTADSSYRRVVEMHDPEQPATRNAILVAPLGRGAYVYSSIAFFEQLPAGVPGSLRLLVNLLSAGCRPPGPNAARC